MRQYTAVVYPDKEGENRRSLRPSVMGNYFWAPGTDFYGRKYAFYSAGQSNTPVDSSGCSP